MKNNPTDKTAEKFLEGKNRDKDEYLVTTTYKIGSGFEEIRLSEFLDQYFKYKMPSDEKGNEKSKEINPYKLRRDKKYEYAFNEGFMECLRWLKQLLS